MFEQLIVGPVFASERFQVTFLASSVFQINDELPLALSRADVEANAKG